MPDDGAARAARDSGFSRPVLRIKLVSLNPHFRIRSRFRGETVIASAVALALGLGWAWREAAFAQERTAAQSQTVTLDQVKMTEFRDLDKPVGKVGVYLGGDTPA